MTQAQRTAITTPANGLLVYQTDNSSGFYYYSGTGWSRLSLQGEGWSLTGNSNTDPSTQFLGTTDNKSLLFRLNNQPAGGLFLSNSNVALGMHSLFNNTTGSVNLALGPFAMAGNTTGESNIAIGYSALGNNISGNNNIGIGFDALGATTGNGNTAIGYYAMSQNNTADFNTATGYLALYQNTTGHDNTANGQSSLENNTTGFLNSAFGSAALSNKSTGNYNTAIGANALYNMTSGDANTAVGTNALFYDQTGQFNSALGEYALYYNTTGQENTATGGSSLFNNTTGNNNTANGNLALEANSTGYNNTSVGYYSLFSNNVGHDNTGVGYEVLSNNTIGAYNTAIGDLAGTINTNNYNDACVGYNSITDADNLSLLGNTTTIYCGGFANWFNYSDGRFKKNVRENVPGLDFVLALRPVTYNVDLHSLNQFIYRDKSEEYEKAMAEGIAEKEKITMTGFIAQEVEAAAQKTGYDFDGVYRPKDLSTDHYSLSYASFVVPLVKAVQEQQNMILKQQKQIDELKETIKTLTNNK